MRKVKNAKIFSATFFLGLVGLAFSTYTVVANFLGFNKAQNTLATAHSDNLCSEDDIAALQSPENENAALFVSCGGFLE